MIPNITLIRLDGSTSGDPQSAGMFPLKEFYAMPVLNPSDIALGGYHCETFVGRCALCALPVKECRGTVRHVVEGDYRSVQEEYLLVIALGYCRPCNTLTPFDYKFGSDHCLESLRPVSRAGWWRRLKAWFKRSS